MAVKIQAQSIKEAAPQLKIGDKVLLSGVIYTARDAAHKRMRDMLDKGEELPFPLEGAVIYYAGPTPTPEGRVIGSCGPTTSTRMDVFTPDLMDRGLAASIGKGERSQEVYEAVRRNGGLYLCALGGAGALIAASVKDCRVIAFEDLGCESIKRLEVEDLPLVVAVDTTGANIFDAARQRYARL